MEQTPSVGQRVRVALSYYEKRRQGRVGEVVRVPKLFKDYVYVRLDLTPRERTQKTDMLPVMHLELLP